MAEQRKTLSVANLGNSPLTVTMPTSSIVIPPGEERKLGYDAIMDALADCGNPADCKAFSKTENVYEDNDPSKRTIGQRRLPGWYCTCKPPNEEGSSG